MRTKHTPGPWHLHVDEQLHRAYVFTPEQRTIYVDGECRNVLHRNKIAEINPDGSVKSSVVSLSSHTHDVGEAYLPNARLIAAAPDLIEALEKIDANAAESADWIRRVAREAIAKAKGGAA